MSHKFLEPIKIGNQTVKNRVMFLAMAKNISNFDDSVSAKDIAYVESVAAGGVGLLVPGAMIVDPEWPSVLPLQPGIYDDRFIPGLRRLVLAAHKYDAKILFQLWHPGATNYSGIDPKTVDELTKDEIHAIQDKFVAAAKRAMAAGADGIEFQTCHGYLACQFISPLFNHRTDEYGWNKVEDRTRFATEILTRIRKVIGPDKIISVKMQGFDYPKSEGPNGNDGITPEQAAEVAPYLEKAGADMIAVSAGGTIYHQDDIMSGDVHRAEGWKVPAATMVKNAVSVPVVATGSIRHPDFVDQIINDGKCDMVGMGRGILAEREWVKKCAEGREDELRYCISCMNCFNVNPFSYEQTNCSVNPFALREGSKRPIVQDGDGRLVAVIGAGPAGMSCAYYLANKGYPVTVFDRNPVPGGMLTLGIPSFRLEKDVLNAEIDILREMGVEFRCGVEVGRDITIGQLRAQGYKGFYLAIGAQKSAPIGIPDEELSGVYGGVDFLRKVNLGKKPRIGKKCAVIGGGNVAMDVCRTAIRLGAQDTYVIYRRSQAEMPADAEEVAEAMEEGVQFRFLSAPAEILGENGKVKAIKVEIMELGEPDEKGRRKPVGTGKFETIEVTSVIGAIGQRVDLGHIAPEAMAFNRNGTVQVDGVTYQTAQPDVFAGGDVVTGPKFAIDAIAAGREGAVSLHRFVHEGQSLTLARDPREFYELDKSNAVLPIDCFDAPARQTVAHDASKAKTFSNDRITFTEAQVKAEASRCLGCGVSVVDPNKCIGCGLCTTRCEFDAIHLQRDMPEASRMYRTEDKMKAILPHMVKRAAKITIKDIKEKCAK